MGQLAQLAGILLAAVVLGLVAMAVRRQTLRRRGATFDCSLRLRTRKHGQGWVFGIARYSGDALKWYRVFSLSLRPKRVVFRRELVVRGRRAPRGPEAMALLAGAQIVECGVDGRAVEFAMSQDALTGFLAWLESAPPGHHHVGP